MQWKYIADFYLTRYCYGGGLSLLLSTRKDLVDVVVACHAAPVDVARLSDAKTHVMMICAEGK
jgi:dienelactone hydrolase